MHAASQSASGRLRDLRFARTLYSLRRKWENIWARVTAKSSTQQTRRDLHDFPRYTFVRVRALDASGRNAPKARIVDG